MFTFHPCLIYFVWSPISASIALNSLQVEGCASSSFCSQKSGCNWTTLDVENWYRERCRCELHSFIINFNRCSSDVTGTQASESSWAMLCVRWHWPWEMFLSCMRQPRSNSIIDQWHCAAISYRINCRTSRTKRNEEEPVRNIFDT